MKTYLLYNPKSNNGVGKEGAKRVKEIWKYKDFERHDLTELNYPEFFSGLEETDEVVICGGDGTLNYLVNAVDCEKITNDIYYYPAGSGNDFWNDLGLKETSEPHKINKYLVNLPVVTVKGKKSKFINGIGYGIDGYCCEEGDRLREKSDKPINYTNIAVKGLLYKYKPANATVEVDGKKRFFKKCWLAPTMNGRYYGGGMMAAPGQDRLNPERTVTVMVMNGAGKIRTLIAFPSIFEGRHVEKTNLVTVMPGKHVKVSFDRPVALQIDGETVLNVTEYAVDAGE
ncbi:MAG TPA: diacylglycerol kinase family protein [Ruminococcaceae bacterium]|nr:diacylglycerol kinase family protein [Oscillospiraceae bacterium]